MNRRSAEEIVPMLVRAAQEVADTVAVYRRHGPEKDVKPFSDAIGKVTFALDDVLRPIILEHPDLDPGLRPLQS